jgi:CHAT domain-containing protein
LAGAEALLRLGSDARDDEAIELPAEPEIQALVAAYNGAIQAVRDPLAGAYPAGARLYELLAAPVEAMTPRGSQIVIAADGALHELAFGTLPNAARYWIEQRALAVTPSLGLLRLRPRAGVTGRDSLLLIGNPAPPVKDFTPLPEVDREIGSIRSILAQARQSVLSGPAATVAAFRSSNPDSFPLVHFAAHAVANRERPLESAVILSVAGDAYKLYARDILGIPLAAWLVTVSACRSAGARRYSGEGLVGFAWAFLQAGAENVISGLWDVNDASTAALMARLYRGLAAGRSPAEALQAAQIDLLRSDSSWRKPYYWGAFQFYSRSHPF